MLNVLKKECMWWLFIFTSLGLRPRFSEFVLIYNTGTSGIIWLLYGPFNLNPTRKELLEMHTKMKSQRQGGVSGAQSEFAVKNSTLWHLPFKVSILNMPLTSWDHTVIHKNSFSIFTDMPWITVCSVPQQICCMGCHHQPPWQVSQKTDHNHC